MDHPRPVHTGTSTNPAGSRRPLAVVLGALVLVVALVAGCSTAEAFTELDTALDDAGFSSTQVSLAPGDTVVLTVSADSPGGDTTAEAQDAAAKVIWETFPRRFDTARISIDGESRTVTAAELQDELGDRPAGLDDQGDLSDDYDRLVYGILIGLLVAGLLAVALAGIIALVVVRRRRNTRRRTADHPVPWAPPPSLGGPVAPGEAGYPGHPGPQAPGPGPGPPGPIPPAGGWSSPTPHAPPPTGAPPADPSAPPAGPPPPPWAPPSHPGAVYARSARETRADAKRLGRPARGPRPPATQIPPGWD